MTRIETDKEPVSPPPEDITPIPATKLVDTKKPAVFFNYPEDWNRRLMKYLDADTMLTLVMVNKSWKKMCYSSPYFKLRMWRACMRKYYDAKDMPDLKAMNRQEKKKDWRAKYVEWKREHPEEDAVVSKKLHQKQSIPITNTIVVNQSIDTEDSDDEYEPGELKDKFRHYYKHSRAKPKDKGWKAKEGSRSRGAVDFDSMMDH